MHDQAFEILGIEPTTDGRAIRAAFVRLARIYHPDRFVGMPDDVRAEAERRMKEATVAYEALSDAAKPSPRAFETITDSELKERTRNYRAAMDARREEEERTRARWRRWDEIERRARERAEIDAEIESMIRNGVSDASRIIRVATEDPSPPAPVKSGSALSQRLESARRGSTGPLVPHAPPE